MHIINDNNHELTGIVYFVNTHNGSLRKARPQPLTKIRIWLWCLPGKWILQALGFLAWLVRFIGCDPFAKNLLEPSSQFPASEMDPGPPSFFICNIR